DTRDRDDRERGNRDGYALFAGGKLKRSEIHRILLRKSPDSFFGGWALHRVKGFFEGSVICNVKADTLLEDDDLTFLACTLDEDVINTLKIEVTTADVSDGGTDDDVFLHLGGHSWNLDNSDDNFESGETDTFKLDPRTGIKVSNLHTITIKK